MSDWLERWRLQRLGATTPLSRGTVTSGHRQLGDGAAESSVAADTAAPDDAGERAALTVRSPANGRLYTRSFDYDACRALYADGWTQQDLAARFGVSAARISQVVNQETGRRAAERHLVWQGSGTCVDCGAQCSRRHKNGKTVERCKACGNEASLTTVRPDTLRCSTCKQWKPDNQFCRDGDASPYHRGRHRTCTRCQTALRKKYRDTHKIPCATCGTPVLHERHNKQKPPECRPCYYQRMKQEAEERRLSCS